MTDKRTVLDRARTRTISIVPGTSARFAKPPGAFLPAGNTYFAPTPALSDAVSPVLAQTTEISREVARVVSFFLEPASLVAFAFGLWRLGVDLDWTENFPIQAGLLSHWIVWIGLGIGMQSGAGMLTRLSGKAMPSERCNEGVADSGDRPNR